MPPLYKLQLSACFKNYSLPHFLKLDPSHLCSKDGCYKNFPIKKKKKTRKDNRPEDNIQKMRMCHVISKLLNEAKE